MKKEIIKTSIIVVLLIIGSIAFSQTSDSENCKDHPLFERVENFSIQECSETFDEYEFRMGDNVNTKMNGTIFKIIYSYDSEADSSLYSKMQIIKNYENEIADIGGTTVYSKTVDDTDWTGATFHFEKDSIEYWLGIYDMINNPVDQYTFVLFVGMPSMQVVTEKILIEKINAGEPIPLYINFESFETTIKDESEPIIDELYKMLSDNPTLRIVVAGHTDNVGDEVINQILSEGRALSVKQALIDKGISFRRIEAIGYGEVKPIADNESVEGRARNRRVEIAKCVDQ